MATVTQAEPAAINSISDAPAQSPVYAENLRTLCAFQPKVAALIDAVPVPDSLRLACGRDGSPTFMLPGLEGRVSWFGGSSTPTISAEELMTNVAGEDGNVILPGMLTGREPVALARRLPECRAVFVVENDPLNLKLAMQLHDYRPLFSRGRLVFFPVRALAECMTDFFSAYPGYLFPAHILRVPQRTASQISELQEALESAGRMVADTQARGVEQSASKIGSRKYTGIPPAPTVVVTGADASGESIEFAGRISRALKKLGWRNDMCVPDGPGKCHLVARMRAIERARADVVIWINGHPGAARSLLPPELPIVRWFSFRAVVDNTGFQSSPGDCIATSCIDSVNDPRVTMLGPAADDPMFKPVALERQEYDALAADVTVIADLPFDEPQSCGVTLPSLVALWRSLQSVFTRDVEQYRPADGDRFLREAERLSGTTLTEAPLREQFLGYLRHVIAPAAIRRSLIDVLTKSDRSVAIWGTNWSHRLVPYQGGKEGGSRVTKCVGPICRGLIPPAAQLNHIFSASKLVIVSGCSQFSLQMAIDALCAGACVLVAAIAEIETPGLAAIPDGLQRYLHVCTSRAELKSTADALLVDDARRKETGLKARELVLAAHTISHRIESLVDRLRARQGSPTV